MFSLNSYKLYSSNNAFINILKFLATHIIAGNDYLLFKVTLHLYGLCLLSLATCQRFTFLIWYVSLHNGQYLVKHTVPLKVTGRLNEKQQISLNAQFIIKSTDVVCFNS